MRRRRDLGRLLRLGDSLLRSPLVWKRASGAFLVSQVFFVVVTGSANLLAAIAATICGAALLRFGLAGRVVE